MNRKPTPTRNAARLLLLTTLLIGMMLLAACGSGSDDEPAAEEAAPTEAPTQVEETEPTETPTEEPAPTEAPAEAPAEEIEPMAAPAEEAEPTAAPAEETTSTSPIDAMEHTPDPMLVDITWEWVMREPNGNSFGDITVANPESYTLLFNADGSFAAQLDCNNGAGRYATSHVENEHKNIFMELGPMTMAACGEDSLDTDMVNMFGPAQSYRFEDDGNTLVFAWVAGGPLDYYRNAAATPASKPDAEADDTVADDAEAATPAEPVTAPDELDTGSLILFSASRKVVDGNRVDAVEDIYSVAAAPGSEATLIIENAKQPALQPEGQILAFRSKQSDQLGLGAYDFEMDTRLRYSGFEEDSTPSWSPTGDRIVFGSNRTGDRLWRIYIIEPVAGVNPSDLAEAIDLGFGKDPDWHPSEEVIVFKGCDETGNNCGLWAMNSDGSERSQLTDGFNDSLPHWSPDGVAIAFMSDSRDGNWELYRVNAIGDEVTRLSDNAANDGHPAWSPDGSQLAFMSNRDEAWGVWIMAADGGEAQLVTPFEDAVPDWLLQGIDWPR